MAVVVRHARRPLRAAARVRHLLRSLHSITDDRRTVWPVTLLRADLVALDALVRYATGRRKGSK